jgi:hypothetical protein
MGYLPFSLTKMYRYPTNSTVNMLRHLEISLLFVLLITTRIASANESPFCSPNQNHDDPVTARVAMPSAGSVTAGEAVLLRGLVDEPTSTCSEKPCMVNPGVAGIKLRQAGPWICIGVPGKGKLGTIFGWLPAERWHPSGSGPQPPSRWVGVWQNESAKITIQSSTTGELNVEGHAIWIGGPLLQAHFGDFELTDTPDNGVVTTASTDSCKVAVRLVGDFLVAADNGACGGMNVNFDGMYRLRHH